MLIGIINSFNTINCIDADALATICLLDENPYNAIRLIDKIDNVEAVINSTNETLKMFPDRKLFGEDVIGSEYENGTFYSSHRILSTASHLGDGFYGTPTGSKLTYRVIADCIL